jgi:hypothetical protein
MRCDQWRFNQVTCRPLLVRCTPNLLALECRGYFSFQTAKNGHVDLMSRRPRILEISKPGHFDASPLATEDNPRPEVL